VARAAPPDHPGARQHDGFYLRLATGFGGSYRTVQMEGYDPGVTLSGVSSVGELALGYALGPGRIVGLGWYSGTLVVTARDYHIDQPMPPATMSDDADDFDVIGPFTDLYFDAQGGFHLQLALGVAALPDARLGGGAMLGLGYEWWVSDQWSLGVLGRVTATTPAIEERSGARWVHGPAASPSLLFTATWN
jgi:hypothetical protein